MTKTSKLTAFAAASAIAVASMLPVAAFAQETGAIPNSSTSAEAAKDIGVAGTGQAASPVIVQRIDGLENDEARAFENLTADQVAAAQQEITANPALAAELQSQGVQLNNVVDVITFPDGNALVYVR